MSFVDSLHARIFFFIIDARNNNEGCTGAAIRVQTGAIIIWRQGKMR